MSIALLDQILLRTLSDPVLIAKGDDLTWPELDLNLVIIHDAIRELANISGDGFEPYNAGTTYSQTPDTYVSYNGNIWHYINPTPQSGVTPGSDPLTWEIVSLGQFAHEKDKDQYLDFGGPYQVSAQDIFNLLASGYLPTAGGTMTGDIAMTTGTAIKNLDVPDNRLLLSNGAVALFYDDGVDTAAITLDPTGILLNASLVTMSENLLLDSASGSITISAIDGGWRHRIDGTDLIFERRESSVWTEKFRIGA